MRVSRMRPEISCINFASSDEWAAVVSASWNCSSPRTPRSPASISASIAAIAASIAAISASVRRSAARPASFTSSASRASMMSEAVGAFSQPLDRSFLGGPAEKDRAVAVPDGQKPLHLEGHQRLAEGGSAHAEFGGQFALGRSRSPGTISLRRSD